MTSGGVNALTYDLNGNLTSDGVNSYTYDAENRLSHAAITDQDHIWRGTVGFSYDPFGRLEKRHVTPENTSTTSVTSFLHDGEYQVAEYAEVADAQSGVISQSLLRRYVYGPGVDEPILMVDYADPQGTGDDDIHVYYHQDRRGSVIALSDEAGVVAESFDLSPFIGPLPKLVCS